MDFFGQFLISVKFAIAETIFFRNFWPNYRLNNTPERNPIDRDNLKVLEPIIHQHLVCFDTICQSAVFYPQGLGGAYRSILFKLPPKPKKGLPK